MVNFILCLQAKLIFEINWFVFRTACKKLILHDLPPEAEVGLVMFNEEAYVAHPIGIIL